MIFYPGWYLKRVRMLFSKITLILLFPNRVTIMESIDYSQGLFLNLCVSLFCWRERTRAVCNRLPLNFWWLRATEAWLEKNSTKTIVRSIDLQDNRGIHVKIPYTGCCGDKVLGFLKCLFVLVCPNELLLQMGEVLKGVNHPTETWTEFSGAKKTTRSSFVFWLHIEYSLRYLRTGLRPSEVSTWPMKAALWDLNLILSGLSFRLWDVKRLSSSRTVLSWSRAAWSIESLRPITIISLAIFSTPSISRITLWRHHWNSSGAELTLNGRRIHR